MNVPTRIKLRPISPRKTFVTKEYSTSYESSGDGSECCMMYLSAIGIPVFKGLKGTRAMVERQHPGVEVVIEDATAR